MSVWIELRAYWKLLVVIVQVRCGRAPENTSLHVTPAEADALMRVAAANGWRAVVVKLQQARRE